MRLSGTKIFGVSNYLKTVLVLESSTINSFEPFSVVKDWIHIRRSDLTTAHFKIKCKVSLEVHPVSMKQPIIKGERNLTDNL